MTTDQAKQDLRELIEERVAAVARRDAEALAAHQAADVLAFNVLPPLRLRGADQVAPQTRAWFDAYASGPGYEVRDLQVDADGDLGYCAFLYHVTGRLQAGMDVSMGTRHARVPPARRAVGGRPRPRVDSVGPGDRSGSGRPRSRRVTTRSAPCHRPNRQVAAETHRTGTHARPAGWARAGTTRGPALS
ncbi:hypothetical protein CO540_10205 [Micromonospora sp. WMMA2032]|nr:nuclear transport factor 2 family protein [Micromonospora sp. WMMA2032]ATO14146.1 hypothetical protein CO540_10205 [Micromonospora sp. WMMA2032]